MGPDIPVNGMSGPHHFPAPEAAGAHPARRQGAGGDGPSASLRASRGVAASARVQPPRRHVRRHATLGPSGTDPDNGTCPAMPGAAGPGNGAALRRAAPPAFLLDRSATPNDRNRLRIRATQSDPEGSACSRTLRRLTLRSTKRSKRKKSRDRFIQGGTPWTP